MDDTLSYLKKFFGVVAQGQTYLNLVYLLLSFPLGLFYFIFLVVGLCVGISLTIIWIGLLILALVFGAWYGFIAFERQMAILLLREDIPPMTRQDLSGKSLWQKFTATITNSVTWKGLAYLLAKFPLGLFSFITLVTLFSISISLLAAPFYYQYIHYGSNLTIEAPNFNPAWVIDTLPEAEIACLVGALLAVVSLHIFNGLAWVSAKFARIMLGNFDPAPAAPLPVEPAPAPQPAPADTYEV